MGGIDAAMRVASGEGIGKAIGGAAATTIGSTLGGILGQTLIPIPGVGAAVGAVAGGLIGDKLFSVLTPDTQKQEQAATTQMAAAARQMEAAQAQVAKDTGVQIGGAAAFMENPQKLYQAMVLMGEQNNPTAKALLQASGDLKLTTTRTGEAEKKLNDTIESFIKPTDKGGLGYTRAQANLQPEVIAARKEYDELLKRKTTLSKQVDTLFTKLPPALTQSLVKVVSKVSDPALTAAFVAKINSIRVPNQPTFEFKFPTKDKAGPANGIPLINLNEIGVLPNERPQGEGLARTGFPKKSKNWGEGCSVSGSIGSKSVGSVDAFNPLARAKGLSLTSGFRPGSKGWHGVNRARDYSNGYAPTPQMMAFAKQMVAEYGGNLKELIYTPLGFSIKNGKKVPPIAASGHYNHVHVAYANGLGNPILAPTKRMAQQIDAKALGRANIETFTAGKGEFGSGTTVNGGVNISIDAAGMQDPQEIAYAVAREFESAIGRLNSSSLLV
jgi:polyhydroxyalkanoate synthesis regulator phasin